MGKKRKATQIYAKKITPNDRNEILKGAGVVISDLDISVEDNLITVSDFEVVANYKTVKVEGGSRKIEKDEDVCVCLVDDKLEFIDKGKGISLAHLSFRNGAIWGWY